MGTQGGNIELVTNKFLDDGDNLAKIETKQEMERGASFYLKSDQDPFPTRSSPKRYVEGGDLLQEAFTTEVENMTFMHQMRGQPMQIEAMTHQ